MIESPISSRDRVDFKSLKEKISGQSNRDMTFFSNCPLMLKLPPFPLLVVEINRP